MLIQNLNSTFQDKWNNQDLIKEMKGDYLGDID